MSKSTLEFLHWNTALSRVSLTFDSDTLQIELFMRIEFHCIYSEQHVAYDLCLCVDVQDFLLIFPHLSRSLASHCACYITSSIEQGRKR